MELGAVGSDAKPDRDLLICEALTQQVQHLPLTRREDVRMWRASATAHSRVSIHGVGPNYTTRPLLRLLHRCVRQAGVQVAVTISSLPRLERQEGR